MIRVLRVLLLLAVALGLLRPLAPVGADCCPEGPEERVAVHDGGPSDGALTGDDGTASAEDDCGTPCFSCCSCCHLALLTPPAPQVPTFVTTRVGHGITTARPPATPGPRKLPQVPKEA